MLHELVVLLVVGLGFTQLALIELILSPFEPVVEIVSLATVLASSAAASGLLASVGPRILSLVVGRDLATATLDWLLELRMAIVSSVVIVGFVVVIAPLLLVLLIVGPVATIVVVPTLVVLAMVVALVASLLVVRVVMRLIVVVWLIMSRLLVVRVVATILPSVLASTIRSEILPSTVALLILSPGFFFVPVEVVSLRSLELLLLLRLLLEPWLLVVATAFLVRLPWLMAASV